MKDDKGIIFLHGAGLSSRIWKDLMPLLKVRCLAVDFPNRNKDDKANAEYDFDDYFFEVLKQVELFNAGKLVIIAHSIGGCMGLKVAKHFKENCVGFVGISAAIPRNGDSYLSCFPFPQSILLNAVMTLLGTRPPDKAIEKDLCNDLSEMQAAEIIKNFTPESKALYTDKCNAGIPSIKKLYIRCSNDKAFPFSLQTKMAAYLETKEIKNLDSGHLPMLSQPMALAVLLNDFIKSC